MGHLRYPVMWDNFWLLKNLTSAQTNWEFKNLHFLHSHIEAQKQECQWNSLAGEHQFGVGVSTHLKEAWYKRKTSICHNKTVNRAKLKPVLDRSISLANISQLFHLSTHDIVVLVALWANCVYDNLRLKSSWRHFTVSPASQGLPANNRVYEFSVDTSHQQQPLITTHQKLCKTNIYSIKQNLACRQLHKWSRWDTLCLVFDLPYF